MSITQHDLFEQFVAQAWDNLPEEFRAELDNVDVVVEEWPDPEAMRRAGVEHRAQLLGLYHGVPLTRRTQGYNLVLPDKISIYRQPIMMRCRNWEQVRRVVHRVLRHEVGHYFGLSDERLREIGAY
jgi:predicted Zn-dependent protease with MMP-like domain